MAISLSKKIIYSGKEIIKSRNVSELIDGRPEERNIPGQFYVSSVFFFCPQKCRRRGTCKPPEVYKKIFLGNSGILYHEVGHGRYEPVAEVNDEISIYTTAACRAVETGKSKEVECPGKLRKFKIRDFTKINKFDFHGLFSKESEIYMSDLI